LDPLDEFVAQFRRKIEHRNVRVATDERDDHLTAQHARAPGHGNHLAGEIVHSS